MKDDERENGGAAARRTARRSLGFAITSQMRASNTVKLDERERAGRLFGYYVRTKLNAGCQPRNCPPRPPKRLDEVVVMLQADVGEVAGDEKPPVVSPEAPSLDGAAADGATLSELEPYLFDGDADLAVVYHADRAVLLAADADIDGIVFAEGDAYVRLPSPEVRHAVQMALHEGGDGGKRGRDGRGGGYDD